MRTHAELPNPFDSDVVTNPNQNGIIDVPEIHRGPFEVCCAEYEQVTATQTSRSVLFSGEAGCGKTHLLARFRRWLRGDMETRPSHPPAALITVRMETAPSQVWRHLRRRFAEHVLEPRPDSEQGATVLDAHLEQFAARIAAGNLGHAFDRSDTGLTLESIRVLERFSEGKHRRICRAWLKGESLSDGDRRLLGLADLDTEDLDEESGEAHARTFVLAMTRLFGPSPVVFCFDQIEALGLSTAANSFGPFTRMGASLVDETTNAFVVSSILSNYLTSLRSIQTSDYHRVSKVVQDIPPLGWTLGAKLIEARLDSVPGLQTHRPKGGVSPLREADLRKAFGDFGHTTARKLIHEAKRLYAIWQGTPPAPRVPLDQFLQSALDALREHSAAQTQAPQVEEILAHGLPLAARLAGFRVAEKDTGDGDFEAGPEDTPIWLALCNQPHATSLFHRLRRLRGKAAGSGFSRLCLVRDPRLPVPSTAKKTRQMLQSLLDQGARFVRPDTEAIAVIDAIRKLLAKATSGDLSHDGDTVSSEEVRTWLEANLPHSLTSFVDELCSGTTGSTGTLEPDPLVELLRERKILAAPDAAKELGWTAEQVVEYARANPGQAGVVEGPLPVVFHVVAAADGSDDARA